MSQHRNSVTIPLKVNDHASLNRCSDDKSTRVFVFCAADMQGPQDVAFPHQSEIKVNGGEMKANLRGLKGKPGSTRPVDITDSLRLKPNYVNNVNFTYALTTKVKKPNPSCRGQGQVSTYLRIQVDSPFSFVFTLTFSRRSSILPCSCARRSPSMNLLPGLRARRSPKIQ